MTALAPGTAGAGAPLGATWLLAALVVGPSGYLLYALSEAAADRTTGLALGGAAVLAALTGAAAVAGSAVRLWSLALSAAFVALGITAAAVQVSHEPTFASDVLLLGLPAVLAGLVTAALALRGR